MPSRASHHCRRLITLLFWLALPLFGLLNSSHSAQAAQAVQLGDTMDAQLIGSGLEYYVDETHELDFEAVRRGAAFRPVERSDYHFPVSNHSYWFRFSLHNPSEQALEWLLEYNQEYLDRLDVYVLDQQGTLREEVNYHLKQPDNPRLINYRHFLAPFSSGPGETLTFYIRADRKLVGPLSPSDVRLWNAASFQDHVADQYFWFGLFYGGMFIALLYNLMLYFSIREHTYLYYVFYLVAISFSWMTQNGLSRQFIWPGNSYILDHAAAVFALLSVIGGSLYTRSFLNTIERSPRVDRFMLLLIRLSLIALVISLFGAVNLMINVAYLLIAVGVFTYPFIGAYIWAKGYKPARIYTLAWIFFGFGTFALVMQHHGIASSHPFNTWAGQVGAWVEAILLSIALADRFNAVQKEKEEAQNLYRETLLRAKLELEERVNERTAELNDAKEAAERLARTDPLTGMANRRCFFEQAEHNLSLSRRYEHPLAVLILDVDHFKHINDQYGHAIGDLALKAIAKGFPESIRETDIAGRIGGEEFAVLLPETNADEAMEIAERIRTNIAAIELKSDAQLVPLRASLGLAVLEGEEPFSELLARADQALYQAKERGRNRVIRAA